MIRRYVAEKDTTITNAFKLNLVSRGTNANMGASDILEVFSIYGQSTTSSLEKSRTLVQFPVDDVIADISASLIPNSAHFYLRMFNAVHPNQLPKDFTINIAQISSSWDEGYGLDMETYEDDGICNWYTASSTASWVNEGGDFYSSSFGTQFFDLGTEDLEVDVTSYVQEWISGTKQNYGLILMLSGSNEDGSSEESFYTKQFFGRGSEFWFKRPTLEARFDAAIKDNRGNFFASSSIASAVDNLNTLYLYNKIRGQYKNIDSIGTGSIYVQVFSTLTGTSLLSSQVVTGGYVSPGIYSASFALNSTASVGYDRWFSSGLTTCFYTGTFAINSFANDDFNVDDRYVTSISNLKSIFSQNERNARFRSYIRPKNWSPTIYVESTETLPTYIIEDAYFKVSRESDNLTVLDYGTASATNHTRLSYDVSGNYFDLDMSQFEKDYMYSIKFIFKDSLGTYREQKEKFIFRVE